MAEELNYKGYRMQVSPQGPGWKVIIYAPGAMLALDEIPYTPDPTFLSLQFSRSLCRPYRMAGDGCTRSRRWISDARPRLLDRAARLHGTRA
jgi:hypothetical protein